jgi:Fe2+ transport system protein FeoA
VVNLRREYLKLSDLKKGDRAIIKRIDADESLKKRLASFGVGKGSELIVETCSIGKKTFEIIVDGTMIAIRGGEAKRVEVEKIN